MPRPRGNRKEARLSVSLDAQEYAKLCALAHSRDVSVAWMVRQAIHDMLAKERDERRNPELPLIRRAAASKRAAP
jgi:hypothetical protein